MLKVRFAPSPTGYLHIGNARAAIINYLFAIKNKGEFILRIDDTDLARSSKEYEDAIFKDIDWLGIKYNQTFKQSNRMQRYEEVKNYLIKTKRLYPCFESSEELEFKRKKLLAKGKPPIYDRASLELSDKEINELIKNGHKPHWRFKLNHENIIWDDLIRGEVKFDGALISDPVLVREDGVFLYSLCSVVDDIDYKVTHIIRGEDHVTNTATQIQLFQAIEKDYKINFAHTTLLMDENNHPLSKRLGSLSIAQMRQKGIEPISIACLLSRLGTSLDIKPMKNLEECAKDFDLSCFSKTPPCFSEKDLWNLNHKIYSIYSYEEFLELLKQKNIDPQSINALQWDLIKGNIENLQNINMWNDIFNNKEKKYLNKESIKNCSVLNKAYDCLLEFNTKKIDQNIWGEFCKKLSIITGIKGKNLFMPLRLAITGMEHGPEMKEIIALIDREVIFKRLNCAD